MQNQNKYKVLLQHWFYGLVVRQHLCSLILYRSRHIADIRRQHQPASVTQTISDQKTLNVLQQAKKWIHSILELFLAKRNELSFNGIKSTKKCIKITVSMRVERNSHHCFQALLFARLSLSRNFAIPLFLTVRPKFVLLQHLTWNGMWKCGEAYFLG